eukprot:TRINITY_DN1238_c0_g1_i1.p1 TRINITY_DN1238_c0_g1~~TRINITY_DN1238_c0_g1_i1.p1  ORF type:complete len:324 (-),score=66.38 TRINITY_DN1238_c0_g1_i1:231-1202(-)
MSSEDAQLESLPASVQNLVEQTSLRWIFVGGKGGVGKTTTSCCIASLLSQVRESVLLISTDPAHNLSDAFNQKFGPTPTLVNGYTNLYAMEIDVNFNLEATAQATGSMGMMSDMAASLPGVDELMSFVELMKSVTSMNHSVVVFDTAPTGHTLRLLSFPRSWEGLWGKISSLKSRFSGIMSQVMNMMSGEAGAEDQLFGRFEAIGQIISQVNEQFRDPERTTFVCVCIPEFLSLYETERLVQELAEYNIDTHNIVVNQIIPHSHEGNCGMCSARIKIQDKYLSQIAELYQDFYITKLPLQTFEVRGAPKIQEFSRFLVEPAEL